MEQLEVNNSINHMLAIGHVEHTNLWICNFGGNRTGRLILNMFFGCAPTTTGREL